MTILPLVVRGLVLAAAGYLAASPTTTTPAPASAPVRTAGVQEPVPPRPVRGHFVLVVEGNVLALRITRAVAKPDPWAGVPKGPPGEFALLIADAKGQELARVPIDLSAFETDPTKVGGPVVVRGCEVRSPNIGVLVNAPDLEAAARYTLVRGRQVLGTATGDAVRELLRGGR